MAESICRFASFELSQQWYGPTESKHTILGPKEAIVDNRSRRILQIELKNAEFKSFRREREREKVIQVMPMFIPSPLHWWSPTQMPACQNSESPETGNIYTLKLPKRCGPLMVDPSPTSSTPSCLILLGAQQEKALKTLEKAKAKAMEKVPWRRLIFRDLSGSSMDQGISWSSKDFLLFQLLGISFQRFPRDDPRLRNAWGKRPGKWVSHHWSLWKCHGVTWEDAAGGLLGSTPDRPSVYPYSVGRGWVFWKGFTVEGV